jgi:hypothetical protein
MRSTKKSNEYNIIDFFPNCVLPSCERAKDGLHQHIYPHQQAILDSTSKYLYCQGGVGSGKSVPFAIKTVYLSLTVPENVGVVSRKDFKILFKSSWLDIKNCIKRLVQKNIIEPPRYSDKHQGDYTTIEFKENGSILYAMQGKAWIEALGPSYGLFWIDDAQESSEEVFVGNEVSAGLISRLRLPHVHFDKKTYKKDTREHGSLHGMISTNPPPYGHYLHKLFGKESGFYKLGDDFVEHMQVNTNENPAVGDDYIKGITAIQLKMGRSSNVIRRVIGGESIAAYGGLRVYPEFVHAKHVDYVTYKPEVPIVRSWDFGFLHPGVLFSHLYKCPLSFNHYVSLSEIADESSLNVWDLYKVVKDMTDRLYKDCCLILDAGDRAGARASSSNRDNRSDMRILSNDYNLSFKWRHLDLAKSLEYMRSLLKTKCKCGLEMIVISNNCPVLIGALEGGYKYGKQRDGKISEKPVEDRYFADIACAWRYGAECYVKWGIPFSYHNEISSESRLYHSRNRKESWSWMEASPSDIAKLVTS